MIWWLNCTQDEVAAYDEMMVRGEEELREAQVEAYHRDLESQYAAEQEAMYYAEQEHG